MKTPGRSRASGSCGEVGFTRTSILRWSLDRHSIGRHAAIGRRREATGAAHREAHWPASVAARVGGANESRRAHTSDARHDTGEERGLRTDAAAAEAGPAETS